MIRTEHLSKRYGSTLAVDDLSFTVPDGVVTGFLGPNGSGKSTTMRLMLDLDHGSGTTSYDGQALRRTPSTTRSVGAHLDAKYFHPKRSARNHLRMLATEARLPDRRVDEVLDIFGLASVARKRPGGFSLGMGQRLGLAGAVLAQPKNLMLDEPANGLDPQSIHWLRDYLKAYAASGNAVLVSSHLLAEMQLMADQVVVIAQGRKMFDGSLAELVANSTHNDVLVRVRASDLAVAQDALISGGLTAVAAPPAGDAVELAVTSADPGPVGMALFAAGVPVLELSPRRASLEQAFLEVTEGREQFKTGVIYAADAAAAAATNSGVIR
ncbi:MAG: ABC transporter ATP-binding protein [Candidatus Nanopelagicales bacterium]